MICNQSLILKYTKNKKGQVKYLLDLCDPTGARTQDPIIKSDVLYRLSYRVYCSLE
jgi:hypothetical protein